MFNSYPFKKKKKKLYLFYLKIGPNEPRTWFFGSWARPMDKPNHKNEVAANTANSLTSTKCPLYCFASQQVFIFISLIPCSARIVDSIFFHCKNFIFSTKERKKKSCLGFDIKKLGGRGNTQWRTAWRQILVLWLPSFTAAGGSLAGFDANSPYSSETSPHHLPNFYILSKLSYLCLQHEFICCSFHFLFSSNYFYL